MHTLRQSVLDLLLRMAIQDLLPLRANSPAKFEQQATFSMRVFFNALRHKLHKKLFQRLGIVVPSSHALYQAVLTMPKFFTIYILNPCY